MAVAVATEMRALDLIDHCAERGITLYLDEQYQVRKGPGAIDETLRQALKARREPIRAALYLRRLEAEGEWGYGDCDLFGVEWEEEEEE